MSRVVMPFAYRAGIGRQPLGALCRECVVRRLLGLLVLEGGLPLGLQRPGHQTVVRVHRLVPAVAQVGVVPGPVEPLPPVAVEPLVLVSGRLGRLATQL
jgi:hypothetical protein